jgi:hypothetical protein
MDWDELLQTSHPPEPGHRSLSPLKGQVRILGPTIEMPPCLLAAFIPNDLHGRPIGFESARYDDAWIAMPPHCFLHEFQGSGFVPLLGDIGLQHLTFMIDGPPKVVAFPPDPHENLVQVPTPLRAAPHGFGPAFPDLMCEASAEPIDPETDALVANVDPAFVQQVFDIPKWEWESNIHHHAKLDDLGRSLEVTKWVLGHFPRLNARIGHLKPGSFDNAHQKIDSCSIVEAGSGCEKTTGVVVKLVAIIGAGKWSWLNFQVASESSAS